MACVQSYFKFRKIKMLFNKNVFYIFKVNMSILQKLQFKISLSMVYLLFR